MSRGLGKWLEERWKRSEEYRKSVLRVLRRKPTRRNDRSERTDPR